MPNKDLADFSYDIICLHVQTHAVHILRVIYVYVVKVSCRGYAFPAFF